MSETAELMHRWNIAVLPYNGQWIAWIVEPDVEVRESQGMLFVEDTTHRYAIAVSIDEAVRQVAAKEAHDQQPPLENVHAS